MKPTATPRSRLARLTLTAIAAAIAPMAAVAQSTTGTIFGQAPAEEGDTVSIVSDTGLNREVQVDARGRYSASQLPLGSYTVTLRRDGKTLDTRSGIALRVGAGIEVNFSHAAMAELAAVSVTGNKTPPIDVTGVDSRTVVTAEQLRQLPLSRSAEAIAQLAPGVINNSAGFTNTPGLPTSAGGGNSLVSFGGSAASENAYYINGFATTDPLRGFGGLELPYGSIDQQEVYTGGYSAQYGRSDGGVINQVGRRGTNDWHFGFQAVWEPDDGRAQAQNEYYRNGLPASPVAGSLYQPSRENELNSTTYSAYVGGPIVQDRLYFFVAGEFQHQYGHTVNAVDDTSSGAYDVKFNYGLPRWYAKLDWNITDSHILEFTSVGDERKTRGTLYDYDYATLTRGAAVNAADNTRTGGYFNSLKYTGYLTDDLTVSALYGKMRTKNQDVPGSYDPSLTYVTGITNQNPALNGGKPIGNNQTVFRLYDPDRANRTSNLRLDLTWTLGNHTLAAGIDNQNAQAIDQGRQTSGPGYYWTYGHADPNTPISTGLGVPATGGFPNGEQGFYVIKNVYSAVASVSLSQRAQYIEDKWQIADRWLLSLGLRNDQFTNYNRDSQAFVRQTKPQWAPRLGFAWDVNGDASFKVYGNAGRYYLSLPLNPALNAAGAALSTQQYFTYGGIGADGIPTALTQISNPVSANGNFGVLPDPRTVAVDNLKSEYQDEFILGFSKQWNDWVWGVKGIDRILRSAIDDYCDIDRVLAKAQSLGYSVTSSNSCYLFNPGRDNTFVLIDTSGKYVKVPLSNAELGFDPLKRKYYALNFSFEHPFNGTWYAKIDYVFSRSYGNTEGQLRSDLRQTAASTSEDWDFAQLMEYTDGPQSNDHTHQFKAYGYYQLTPEWTVSGNLQLISGTPRICLGYYGADHSDPTGYGGNYRYCDGKPSPPGSHGRLPWVRQVDLGLTYRPEFADHKLALSANVFNVFNAQAPLNVYPYSESDPNSPDPLYGTTLVRQPPRLIRLSASYDF